MFTKQSRCSTKLYEIKRFNDTGYYATVYGSNPFLQTELRLANKIHGTFSFFLLSPFFLQQQDIRFYTLLDKTCWLLYVSMCLKYADSAATTMKNGITVVLQENEGRDMSCVISSLTQILLDPYYRTTNGFETLIQKDWVALGHPFR